jgi:Tfp pilus assembly ATPase PilU
MQTFDQSLAALHADGTITRQAALAAATHPHDLRLAIATHDAERAHAAPAAAGTS